MAVTETRQLPAQFVEDLGKDLAKQVVTQTGVPVVSTGIAGITQQPGEDADSFKARQDAARAFTIRQQNLTGLAPQVAAQDALQAQAQQIAQSGVGSFQPFLAQAQQAATDAGTTLSGVQLGAPTTQQVTDFMSPFQSQVIDATLAEFDRNRANTRTAIYTRPTSSFGSARRWSSGSATRGVWHRGSERTCIALEAGLKTTRFWTSNGKLDNKISQIDLSCSLKQQQRIRSIPIKV